MIHPVVSKILGVLAVTFSVAVVALVGLAMTWLTGILLPIAAVRWWLQLDVIVLGTSLVAFLLALAAA